MMKCLSILLLAIPAYASALSLDWDACVHKVIESNPDLKVAEKNLSSLEYTEKASSSGFFPQLTGSLSATRGNSSSLLGSTSDLSAVTNYAATLSLTQNLFTGFQDQAKINQAQANLEASAAALQIAKAKASYNLKSAYAAMLFAQNSKILADDIVKRREANLKLVNLRFESGRENKGSVLLSQSYLEQSKYELLLAQNALHTARVQLAQVLGEDHYEDLSVKGEIPIRSLDSHAELKKMASQSPEYKQAQAQESSSQAAMDISRSSLYPSLSLSGSTGNSGQDWYPSSNRWSLGVTLSIPIFSGGKDYYTFKSSSESFRSAKFNTDVVYKQVLLKIQQSYATHIETIQKLKVDQSFVEAFLIRERIAKEKYNNGLFSFDEWDLIENDLITKQKTLLATQKDRILNEAAWEQSQGLGVFNE